MSSITLDTTLRDLYYSNNDIGEEDITLLYAVPTARVQMASGFPASKLFTYQSPLSPSEDADELAREFLQLVPQLFGFIAGKMPLVMFDLDPDPAEDKVGDLRLHQADAYATCRALTPSQRPHLRFIRTTQDLELGPSGRLAIINPVDSLASLPLLVSAEGHYAALSKRELAFSGLPCPETVVLDTVCSPQELANSQVLEREVRRLIGCLKVHPIPAVWKLPQSLSGQGTFIIRTEASRAAAIRVLRVEIRRMLESITPQNAKWNPCSVILQEMVPGEAVALSLFVTRSGKAVFNACCSQLVDDQGSWGGGFIDYCAQDKLKARYAAIADMIASHVRSLGYWGPMGADIMTSTDGRQLVIDMNVRVTGSHPLGALRGHFQARGLHVAALFFPLVIKGVREDFETAFTEEIQKGSLVVNAWVHMRDGLTSMTTLTLGAPDRESLAPFIAKVNAWKV
ncbi:solid-state culture-specific protein-like protein [Poronia punctata]|nr:solid-state culture-specific protein-like protein [Poronia punctata]